MRPTDRRTLVVRLAAVVAAGTLGYAARDVFFELSLTVTALLLFLAFAALLVVAGCLSPGPLERAAFALGGLTYLAFVGYVLVRYRPRLGELVLLLGAATVLLLALWFLFRTLEVALSRHRTVRLLGALAVAAAVLLYLDATAPDVRLLFAPIETVTVPPVATEGPLPHSTTRHRVGTVTVTNRSPFTRAFALPPLSGCLAATAEWPREAVHVSYGPAGREPAAAIAGGTTQQFAVHAGFPGAVDRGASTTLRVTQGTDCDKPRESPTLVVTVGSG